MNHDEWITDMEECFHKYHFSDRYFKSKDKLRKPHWLKNLKSDKLNMLWDLQDEFFSKGRIALSVVLKANVQLFHIYEFNCPAYFLYTYDEYFYIHTDHLFKIMNTLHSIAEASSEKQQKNLAKFICNQNGTEFNEDLYKQIAEIRLILLNETIRTFRYRLPDFITCNSDVFLTTLLVERDHIPNHYLSNYFYPLITLEDGGDSSPDAMILPKWYWSGTFDDDVNFMDDGHIRPRMNKEFPINAMDFLKIGSCRSFRKEHPLAYIFISLTSWLALIMPLFIFVNSVEYLPESRKYIMGVMGAVMAGAGLKSLICSFFEHYLGDLFTKYSLVLGTICMIVSYISLT